MTPHLELPLGNFAGRYRLRRAIGWGGFATVYLAYDRVRKQEVALKAADVEACDPRRWEKELRNMELLQELKLQHVLPAYESGQHGRIVYFTMPFCRGGSLHDWVAQRGPIPLMAAMSGLDDLGADLDLAHAHEFVHRDIKPQNVLFLTTPQELSKSALGDWGIAERFADETLTETGFPIGTQRYMSPARLRGEKATPVDDQFAVAKTFLDAVCGYISEQNKDYERARSGLPPAVLKVFTRATHEEATARYPSVGVFADALHEAFFEGETSRNRRQTRVAPGAARNGASPRERELQRELARERAEHQEARRQMVAQSEQLVQVQSALSEQRKVAERASRQAVKAEERSERAEKSAAAAASSAEKLAQALANLSARGVFETDEVAETYAAVAGGGASAEAARARPTPPRSSGPERVVNLGEFARRKAREAGAKVREGHFGPVSATQSETTSRADHAKALGAQTLRAADEAIFVHGPLFIGLSVIAGAGAIAASLHRHILPPSLAGPLTQLSLIILILGSLLHALSVGLRRQTDAAAVCAAVAAGIAAILCGFIALRHHTSPMELAPGQWMCTGVAALALSVLLSYRWTIPLQVAALAIVALVAAPPTTLVMLLGLLVAIAWVIRASSRPQMPSGAQATAP